MQAWAIFCLLSIGGETETLINHNWHDAGLWGVLLGVSAIGWSWSAVFTWASRLGVRALHQMTGQPIPKRELDAKALAAEIAQLQSQLSQLRDTATAFDVSCDHTMQQLDARLRRVEQQASYIVPVGHLP